MKEYLKADSFYDVFARKGGPAKQATHYCPGCGHGNVHKMIAEAIDDFGIADQTVFVWPVGCSVFGYYYYDVGNFQAAHGRAPAVATGVKRANPDSIVISYQGDGDLAAIGTAETIHAANRGENISVFFINNAIYGMTGGQMAPTTLIAQRTATTPLGRIEAEHGNPIRVCEMLATLPAPTYIERVALGRAKHILKTRKAIRKAIENQVKGRGYSFVEILAPCPTGWKMTGPASRDWVLEEMTKIFPLGVFKDESNVRADQSWYRPVKTYLPEEVNEYLGADKVEQVDTDGVKLEEPLACKFAGFGGQGILSLGLFLSQIAMRAGQEVSWIPSYGPEMRGGTANCQVNISEKRIGSPLVERPNLLVVMNQPSLEAFEDTVVDGGLLIVDTTMVERETKEDERLRVVSLPASQIADDVGTARVANVVVLGAIIAATDAYPPIFVEKALRQIIKKKQLIDTNIEAFRRGYEYIKKQSQ